MSQEYEEIISQTYTAWYASRVPNNHCKLCSYFVPAWAKDEDSGIRDPRRFANLGYAKCESCGRFVTKIFITDREPQLTRVPDSYETKLDDVADKLLARADPLFPRECYDREAWHDYIRRVYAKIGWKLSGQDVASLPDIPVLPRIEIKSKSREGETLNYNLSFTLPT